MNILENVIGKWGYNQFSFSEYVFLSRISDLRGYYILKHLRASAISIHSPNFEVLFYRERMMVQRMH